LVAEILEMQQTDVRKRIDALVRERNNLNISIKQLKEKLSVGHDNFPPPHGESQNFETR
jgi:regulator of replication initiation timing